MSNASSVSRETTLVDVAALDGVGKAPDQLALAGGVRHRRAISVGKPLPERRPGPLQGALDGGLARVEHVRDLGGAVAEHVAQHERRALAGRQLLQGADERQLDRLPGLVAALRPGGAIRELLQRGRRDRARARAALSGGLARVGQAWPVPPLGGATGRAARSDSGSWRSGRATSAPRIGPRSPRTPARPPAASPERGPRRPERSRGSGSSGRAARAGGDR